MRAAESLAVKESSIFSSRWRESVTVSLHERFATSLPNAMREQESLIGLGAENLTPGRSARNSGFSKQPSFGDSTSSESEE